ncbi:hypothetical protein BOTBODRAFT_29274 [Botryobasidium botryosum FD-172 SS1]|uniref:NAD-dependent epimerase/dehydratase domain-containing protein n=1 Tax=Botryobasidium botryosum (strain FD-172 SS1) TaxID=930990 RepID=A0A067N2G7_BOTB1|nr:hypothetical protein BOTBODRAFT_29274 [Botryobasidium botryosum FD-172 SS1]
MPAVQAPATALVTGASGFIAVWIVKTLLDEGFNVRGTVRSTSKGDYLANLFKEHGAKFSYVLVEDISHEGAFDEAVKGVDAVFHTASPLSGDAYEPDELIKPAIEGTLNALKSVKHHGPSVKRVVITGSVAALMEPKDQIPAIYTEADWNTFAIKEVQEKGVHADQELKYRASKVLAERAAWEFVEQNKSQIEFDITTILPSFVFGPILQEVLTLAQLNLSSKLFYNATRGEGLPKARALSPFGNYVDIRDVAKMHVHALVDEVAGGERFVCSAAPFCWQDIYNALNAVEPPISNIPKSDFTTKTVHPAINSSDKARAVFGFEFTSLQKTAADTLASLREREVVWAASSA